MSPTGHGGSKIYGAAFLVALAAAASGQGAAASAEAGLPPDADETRRYMERIVAAGPRPSGSEANEAVVRYLADTLAEWGWEVTVQEGIGTSRRAATAGWVRNVVGWLPAAPAGGDAADAVLLAAHHDSVVDGPGAMDNAASVAALLATARRLAESPRRARPAVVLFTDGEERYLLGSDLFVRESVLARRVTAVVNLDHSGRGGPLFAFELSPPNRGMLRVLKAISASATGLRAYSFATDVYRLVPFDTDFTVLRTLDVPGVNLAFAGDGYVYHTRLDEPSGVPDESLATLAGTVHGLARHLVVDGVPLGGSDEADGYITFFPLGGFTVSLGRTALWGLALALSALALVQLSGALRRSWREVLRCWLVLGLGLPVSIVLLAAAVAALRAVKGHTQVAYAHPWPFFASLACLAFTALLIVEMFAGRPDLAVRIRLHAVTGLWAFLTAAGILVAPSSSAFFLVPLAGLVAAGEVLRWGSEKGPQMLGAVIAAGALLLAWAGPLAALLPFLMTTVPKMGPEPLLFWPMIMGPLGTLLGSVAWVFIGGLPKRALSAVGFSGAALAGMTAVLILPSYEADRPQRAWLFHVSGADEPYQVLASTDCLEEVTAARQGAGPELDDLFWLDPGWWRSVQPSTSAGTLPRAQVRREGDGVVVEVDPPPGSDVVLLRLPREGIESTTPPAPPEGRGPLVLRWVVAGGRKARFVVKGELGEDIQARVMSVSPVPPAGATETLIPARTGYVVGERAIAFVDLVIPATATAHGGS